MADQDAPVELAIRPHVHLTSYAVDEAGKIFVEPQTNSIVIDGVRCSMEVLVRMANPTPELYFAARRLGSEIVIRQWTREGLAIELFGGQRVLERELAYQHAVQILEGSCLPVGPEGEDWWDTARANELAESDLKKAEIYLENRGLLFRHALELSWVSIRDAAVANSGVGVPHGR